MTLITKKPSPANIPVPYLLAMFGGALAAVLGISVLIGWVTHNVTLIQVSAVFVPMQFNTALGFLLSGLGLLLVVTGRYRGTGIACGILVMLTGLLTLAEYIMGVDLGIDELLLKHTITIQTSHPGRMAPNTALCFSLTGVALAVLDTTAKVWKPCMIVGVLGSLILGLGFIALVGYAVSFEAAYGWGGFTRMAVHTASGFIILGVAVTSLAWHRDVSGSSRVPSWFPVPVGIGVMAIMISIWLALESHEAEIMNIYGITGTHPFINDVLLVVGIVLAAAASLAAYLAQAARSRTLEVEVVNRRLTTEIDVRKQTEALKAGQQHILELILRVNATLTEIYEAVIDLTQKQCPGVRATILTVHDNKLQYAAAPDMPDAYNELIDGLEIGPNAGSCGTAAYRGERVIVADVASDPLCADYRQLGAEYGFRACWSEPIFDARDKVVATFALYQENPCVPGDYEIQLIEVMSMLLSIAIERKLTEEALRESNERFKSAFAEATIGMALVSFDHSILEVNPAFCNMLGYSKEELVGVFFKNITHPDDVDISNDYHRKLIAGEIDHYHFEKRYLHKQGHEIWALLSSSLVRDKDATPLYAIAHIQDITERKLSEDELQKLSRAVEASSAAVIITDADANIEYVNPRFTEITGYTREEVQGQIPRFLLQTEEAPDSVYDEISKSIASKGEWKGDFRNRKKDGSLYWERCSISCVRDAQGKITHFIGIQDDVTHEYELSEQLSYQASHDALTGLVNRREFERRAQRLLSTIRQDKDEHALCFMDLDQFKVINDTCGHTAGDELLRQLSMVLQHKVRKRDTLARLGGDEFGILMEHCSLDHAHRVATSLQKAIQEYQFSWEEHSFKVGVSIGLVAITEAIPNLTELLKEADAACYMAKDLGRNRIHVYRTEDSDLAQRHGEMQWVTRIHRALEENRFCLYAQPIVPLDSRTDKHYELLLRMVGEKAQIIPPGAFLPAAERYDLIGQLDCWVIQKTFTLLAAHPAFLEQIRFISINLSGQSLTKPDFFDFINSELDKSGIDGEKICFEITETAAISNLSTVIRFISTLKESGCRFALDDFGSGLSSFAYLKNLPVDYLKIDGMFVKDIADDPIDHAMVKSINQIGQVMGMQTIAEFVENDEIKGMLREIGVDYAQGYGIGKPLSFDELLARANNVTGIKDAEIDESEV